MFSMPFGRLTLITALITAGTAVTAEQPGLRPQALRPVAPVHLRALKDQEALRALTVARHLEAMKPQLGLDTEGGFVEMSRQTDTFGQTHVRFQQTHKGVKVWNGNVIATLSPEGELLAPRTAVKPGISLASVTPALSQDQAVARALRHLNASPAQCQGVRSELVILQGKDVDGLKFRRDPATGMHVLDEQYSVAVEVPKDAQRLAYHLRLALRRDGRRDSLDLVVDAETGSILKKRSARKALADTPTKSKGFSAYNGEVELDTSIPDPANLLAGEVAGQAVLREKLRAKKEHWLATSWAGGPNFGGIGNKVGYEWDYDMWAFSSATGTFGDGQQWLAKDYSNPDLLTNTNGQTLAVDAHFAINKTWDFYQKFFGREGLDNQGSSTLTFVHQSDWGDRYDNAYWDGWNESIYLGDGTFGGGNPQGMLNLGALDAIAHEYSHGVDFYTANLETWMEGGGISEFNGDLMGTLVEHWVRGGCGDTIPDTAPGANWTIGEQLSPVGEPLRYLYKPSKDGLSHDAWFDGIGADDGHFTSGPLNRAFYFMAQGTSTTDPDRQSAYLPQGMAGIGNTKVAQIWYRVLTTKIADPVIDMHGVRAASLEAAAELFGADAPEVSAVDRAFLAANIGDPAKSPWLDLGQPVPEGYDTRCVLVGVGVPTPLVATMHNFAGDNALTWSLGGLWGGPVGRLTSDGVYTAPNRSGFLYPVTATLKADPKYFGVAYVIPVQTDTDMDAETDAMDAGTVALEFGNAQEGMKWVGADMIGSGAEVNDKDVFTFHLAFQRAFAK